MSFKEKLSIIAIVFVVSFSITTIMTFILFGKSPSEWGATEWAGIAVSNILTILALIYDLFSKK